MTTPLQWSGGRIEGTQWQGIRFLSIEFVEGGDHPAVVTAHLNRPAAGLTEDDVTVRGGRRIPVPPYDVSFGASTVEIRFRGLGDHSPYAVELTEGGSAPLHPFFAAKDFRFTIDCEADDCREAPVEAARPPAQPPAVDLLTKDFNGFVNLLADWVRVRNPHVADLSGASFERVLLDLLAWAGDMDSYYQDRVANEAFVETASQRFSLRQHAVLLGAKLDDGRAPTTVLAFDVERSGFVPEGLEVRMRTSPDEVPISFTAAARTPVWTENSGDRLRVAAFTGADRAEIAAGATEVLLWGHEGRLAAGDRLAFVQGPFSQIVTLTEPPLRLELPGWVEDPDDEFDPEDDAPAAVTRVRWLEPLTRALRPWPEQGEPALSLHANLVDAHYGALRRAVVGDADPGEVPVALTRKTSIVTRRGDDGAYLLRALRVPEWPVVHDETDDGASVPAVSVSVSDVRWARVEHLHASRSYDLHYTAEADEDGAVWLRFGDGVNGREVPLETRERPATAIELAYRIGDPVAGNAGLGTLVEIVRPSTETARDALAALRTVSVTNVVPARGGRAPHTHERAKEHLLSSLRHAPIERAVALEDYATVAMQTLGVGRAAARPGGGLFNTVLVLVDPEGADDLDEGLRRRVHDYVDRLRMTGREHVVVPAEYVPLEVELAICVEPGFAPHLVRAAVLAELRPGTRERPGWFHPDRLSFGDTVRLGDVIAVVQAVPGVRSVTATTFRRLGDETGSPVLDVIVLGRTKVARLDADPDFPEHGTLKVTIVGLDAAPAVRARPRTWRITGVARHLAAAPQLRIYAVGGVRAGRGLWRMTTEEAIAAIKRGERFYVENPVGDAVEVLVARTGDGREYLRTRADGDEPNNLLALPELPDD